MTVIPFKHPSDYPTFTKIVDGESVKCVDLDAMTEAQFKKYCSDTGTEWFQRRSIVT